MSIDEGLLAWTQDALAPLGSVTMRSEQVAMSPGMAATSGDVAPAHRRAPTDVYDDAEALQRWARLAVEAGLRSVAKRKPRKRRTKP